MLYTPKLNQPYLSTRVYPRSFLPDEPRSQSLIFYTVQSSNAEELLLLRHNSDTISLALRVTKGSQARTSSRGSLSSWLLHPFTRSRVVASARKGCGRIDLRFDLPVQLFKWPFRVELQRFCKSPRCLIECRSLILAWQIQTRSAKKFRNTQHQESSTSTGLREMADSIDCIVKNWGQISYHQNQWTNITWFHRYINKNGQKRVPCTYFKKC